MPRFDAVVLTCEHAVAFVPPRYKHCFAGHTEILTTHRAYDIGALALTHHLAHELGVSPLLGRVTRLLIELNRASPSSIFSEFTHVLSPAERDHLYQHYYVPHWQRVYREVARHVTQGRRVLHVSVHSFTPTLRGQARSADIALLYDPQRTLERTFSARWLDALAADTEARWRRIPLQLRRNYPYRGTSDGLTTALRKRFPPGRYAGLELEVNQKLLAKNNLGRRALCMTIARALTCALYR